MMVVKNFQEYMSGYKNGKYHQWRVSIWKFWYLNGKMKFEGIYKKGILFSKKMLKLKRY